MQVEVTCKVCGGAYVPSRKELMQGPAVYRLCPSCRPAAAVAEKAPA